MTTVLTPASPQSTPPDLFPTYGPVVCDWIEAMLVHGEGSSYGRPYRIRPHTVWFIYKWFEYETDAGEFRRWRFDQALREFAKGGAKTEDSAAIALAEFAGPTAPIAPNIPVAAASFEQADLLFGRAKQMATHDNSGLRPFIEAFDTEMLLKAKRGRMFRIAAQAGTNDGGLPTLFAVDELHEWLGRRERVHLIVSGSATKRDDAHGTLNTTTPGHDLETVAGRLHEKGLRGDDPRFLHQWITADVNLDLNDPAQLETAVRQANPWASGDHVERLCRRYADVPEHEFRRYHLCQWVAIPEEGWLNDKPGAWEACEGPARFTDDDPVVMWIDMSLSRDTTSVGAIQARGDGHKPCWARVFDPQTSGGRVDYVEVRDFIRTQAKKLNARGVVYDPRFLEFEAQQLADEGVPMIEFAQSPERMGPACGYMYDLIVGGVIEHDGDPIFTAHVKAAVKRATDRGFTLSKGKSKGAIDACIGLVMAGWELSQDNQPRKPAKLITF